MDPNDREDRGDDFDIPDLDIDLDLNLGDQDDIDPDFGEETEEERAERLAAEEKLEREKRIRIPKARYDEEVGKARERAEAAERRAAELEAALQEAAKQPSPPPANEPTEQQVRAYITELEDKYEELLVDGEREEAREIRKQLNAARDYLNDRRITQATRVVQDQTLGSIKYETTLAQIEAAYPELNPNDDAYDDNLTNEVADLARTFMAAGQSNIQALHRATQLLLGGRQQQEQERATRRRVTIEPPAGLPGQPRTPMSGRTAAVGGIKIESLSQDQFAKLDERTLSKARGDFL